MSRQSLKNEIEAAEGCLIRAQQHTANLAAELHGQVVYPSMTPLARETAQSQYRRAGLIRDSIKTVTLLLREYAAVSGLLTASKAKPVTTPRNKPASRGR